MLQHHTNQVTNLTIAYIGGGSRGWAWGFMTDIARDEQISGTVRLYDIDREAAQRNKIIGQKISADYADRRRLAHGMRSRSGEREVLRCRRL